MTYTAQEDIQAAAQAHVRRTARNKALSSIAGGLVTWLIVFLLGFVTTYYGTYVLSWHWHWFMEPAGFDPLTLRERLGLVLITSLLGVGFFVCLILQIGEIEQKEDSFSARKMAFTRIVFTAIAITMSWAGGWVWNWVAP